MSTRVVRISAIVLLFGALGGVAVAWWRGRSVPAMNPAEWPPIRSAPDPAEPGPVPPAQVVDDPVAEVMSAGGAIWVTPADDGSAPDGFPVKVKMSSGIFHVPGGRFYDRTTADRFYATADAAEADGYRRSKS